MVNFASPLRAVAVLSKSKDKHWTDGLTYNRVVYGIIR